MTQNTGHVHDKGHRKQDTGQRHRLQDTKTQDTGQGAQDTG